MAIDSPTTRIVRTVLGDVPPQDLGPTDAHEHLFLVTPIQPGDEFSDVERAVEEAQTLVAAGASTLVDWTPLGLGRDPAGLARVAKATGLHVVAATGVHRDAHYLPDEPLRHVPIGDLAEQFVADVIRSRLPSGIIKIGASYHHLQPFEQRAFDAAAEAHDRTGAPICIHSEHGTMGLDIVRRLTDLGVPAQSLIIAHLDRNPDPVEHAEVAATGAWLQFDGPGRTKYWPDSTILGLIAELAGRGAAGQILLGGDTGRSSMMRAYGGGPGLDYLFARFRPRLERELGADLSAIVFVHNPARAFSFVPRFRPDRRLPQEP